MYFLYGIHCIYSISLDNEVYVCTHNLAFNFINFLSYTTGRKSTDMAEFKHKVSDLQIVNASANVCGAYNYRNRLLVLEDGTTLCARYSHNPDSRLILGM